MSRHAKFSVIGSGVLAVHEYDGEHLAKNADTYLRTGRGVLEQDTWWTGKDGTVRLIDSLEADHRRFIARMLIDQAPARYLSWRASRIVSDFWSYVYFAEDANWGPANMDEEPTKQQILDQVRGEQSSGAAIEWMRTRPLFRRMVRDLDWTHPGVVSSSTKDDLS